MKKNRLDSLQEKYDAMLPPGYKTIGDDELKEEAQKRLKYLNQKKEQYVDDVDILLEQMKAALLFRGVSDSEDTRDLMLLRIKSTQEAALILEPLTVDEVKERYRIMEDLGEGE